MSKRRAWMVRAGSQGEREEVALKLGCVIVGWPEVGDLTGCNTRSEIEACIQDAYPEASNYLIGNWTGQIDRFVHEIRQGDLVVLPRQDPRGYAVGRIRSEYEYSPDGAPGFRHIRHVEWKRKYVSLDDIKGDLRSSLGSLLTVFELSRNNAAERIEAVERTGLDPGASSTTGLTPGSFDDLAREAHEQSVSVSIRNLINLVGGVRRSASSIDDISQRLKKQGLMLVGSLTDGGIDDEVTITKDEKIDAAILSTASAKGDRNTVADDSLQYLDDKHMFPVSQLESATTPPPPPESVEQGQHLTTARTKMLRGNYSQIIVTNQGATIGVLTWRSMVNALICGKASVSAALDDIPPRFPKSTPIPDIVGPVDRHGYVLITDGDMVCGLVTASDLSARFTTDRLPLMLIEEIELSLRSGVSSFLSSDQIAALQSVRANDSSGLTMGTYPHLFREVDWDMLPWRDLDRDILIEEVEFAVSVRNKLSHFSTDPLPEQPLPRLEGLLRILRSAGPTDG